MSWYRSLSHYFVVIGHIGLYCSISLLIRVVGWEYGPRSLLIKVGFKRLYMSYYSDALDRCNVPAFRHDPKITLQISNSVVCNILNKLII